MATATSQPQLRRSLSLWGLVLAGIIVIQPTAPIPLFGIMDYVLNPVICTVWCAKAAQNIVPLMPLIVWQLAFALLFTGLNLLGIQAAAGRMHCRQRQWATWWSRC